MTLRAVAGYKSVYRLCAAGEGSAAEAKERDRMADDRRPVTIEFCTS